MYFFIFLAHPKPTHEGYGTVDGAYVSCWVNEQVPTVAESVARAEIENLGWDIEDRDEMHFVRREEYLDREDSLARFDEALKHGCVIVFHRWPVGAPDED